MKTAHMTIDQLKQEIANTTNVYKLKSLKGELSNRMAFVKGQFIVKEDLSEFQKLIVWYLKNSFQAAATIWPTQLEVVAMMREMLSKVESKQVVYITKKGVKGVVTSLASEVGQSFGINKKYDTFDISQIEAMNRAQNSPSSLR